MKKSHFVALILGTVGGVFFSLGMCMCLLPEWGMKTQGIICGVVGAAVLLTALLIWRKMEGKAPIRLNGRTAAAVLAGVLGALLLGVGMCLSMLFGHMAGGIAVGLVGIVLLIMLVPLTKGVQV